MITTNYYKRLVNFFENCKNENELKREYVDIKKLFWYFTYENYLPTLHLAVANTENEKVEYYDFETKEKIVDEQDYKPFAKYIVSSKDTFRYFKIMPITLPNSLNQNLGEIEIRPQGIFDTDCSFTKDNIITNTNWENMLKSWDDGYQIYQMQHKDELSNINYYKENPYIKIKSQALTNYLEKTREFVKICVKYDFYYNNCSTKEKCDIVKDKKTEMSL